MHFSVGMHLDGFQLGVIKTVFLWTSLNGCFGMDAFAFHIPRSGNYLKEQGTQHIHVQLQWILPNPFLKWLYQLAILSAMFESPSPVVVRIFFCNLRLLSMNSIISLWLQFSLS